MEQIVKAVFAIFICLIPIWTKIVYTTSWNISVRKWIVATLVTIAVLSSAWIISLPSPNTTDKTLTYIGVFGYLVWVFIGVFFYWPKKNNE